MYFVNFTDDMDFVSTTLSLASIMSTLTAIGPIISHRTLDLSRLI